MQIITEQIFKHNHAYPYWCIVTSNSSEMSYSYARSASYRFIVARENYSHVYIYISRQYSYYVVASIVIITINVHGMDRQIYMYICMKDELYNWK